MAPGVLSSACLLTGKPCRQAAHPADLRSPQASIWGEDMDNLPVPTSRRASLSPSAPCMPGSPHRRLASNPKCVYNIYSPA
jgi:hypothetical protein